MREPTLYILDGGTLGYAIGKLFSQHSNLRSQRSVVNAAKAFLGDLGISYDAMSSQERETLFRNVGRGYAKPFSK